MLTRDGGLHIAGLTDAVLAHLPKPYDMILEWCAYAALEEVLKIDSVAVCDIYLSEKGGQATMRWGGTPFFNRNLTVPLHLYRRTVAHTLNTDEQRRALIRREKRFEKAFFDGEREIDEDMFFCRVHAAIKSVLSAQTADDAREVE